MASSPDASAARPCPQGHRGRRDSHGYGRWTAGPLLGQGPVGPVFRAQDGAGRAAALTVVHGSLAADQGFRTRFTRQIHAMGAVRGRRVAALLDADTQGAAPWLATEYVHGPTLAARVREGGGPLGTADLRILAAALAGALDDIHRAGLVHGGLRPSRVLMAADGPRVVDFGTAGCAAGGAGSTVRPPADIFSLGAVLAFAAAGHGPFDSGAEEDPDLSGVPAELLPLVTACLAAHPTARPAPRTVARMAGLPLPGSRRRSLTLAGTLLLSQLAAVAVPLGGRWTPRTNERCAVRGEQ